MRPWTSLDTPWPTTARPFAAALLVEELAGWASERDPRTVADLAEMYASVRSGLAPVMGWTTDEWTRVVLPTLRDAFTMGTLQAREIPRPVFSGPFAWSSPLAPKDEEPTAAEPETATLTIELLGLDGQPMQDQRFSLRHANQKLEQGKLNASGRARFAEAPLGTAVLRWVQGPEQATGKAN